MSEECPLPCKYCSHPGEQHFIFEDTAGGWVYNADVGHEVWVTEPYPRPVCNLCKLDCIFEEMTNLEYLEWLSEDKNKCP